MRRRAAVLRLAATATVLALALLAGCSAGNHPERTGPSAGSSPALGGAAPGRRPPPSVPMDALERPVAAQLARRVARDGLQLDYLDCPHWDGTVPRAMTCRGYVDGLVGQVRVHLMMGAPGSGLRFDARLTSGVLATERLEDILRRRGWRQPDCGDRAAYPAEVGVRIVCRVVRGGDETYVVAVVSDRSGAVLITDYHGTGEQG